MKTSILNLIIFFIIFSCKKPDHSPSPVAVAQNCSIASITQSGAVPATYNFNYGSSNHISTEDETVSGSSSTATFTYDAAGNITGINNVQSGIFVISFSFTYDGSKNLVGIASINSLGETTSTATLTYNSSGQLTSKHSYDPYGGDAGRLDYTYADATSKNPTLCKEYYAGGLFMAEYGYTYDSNPTALNPSTNYIIGGLITGYLIDGNFTRGYFGENNVTQVDKMDHNGAILNTTSISYQYDSNKNPSLITIGSATWSFKYNCK
jgi:YD repeat-containing protein